jgi:hypothetical protein
MPVAVDGQLKEKSFSVDEMTVSDVHGIEAYPVRPRCRRISAQSSRTAGVAS